MKITGIIAEYNPFHNGHIRHLQEARIRTNCDGILVLMSGDGVQRGGFAVADKWQRAQCAVAYGADLVCELPYVFAGQGAAYFAGGAVRLLNACGCSHLSFGAETPDIDVLGQTAALLTDASPMATEVLKTALAKGESFAVARTKALAAMGGNPDVLRHPNDILAVEYMKAIRQIKSEMCPCPIPRAGADHHNDSIDGNIASASAIRKAMLEGRCTELGICMPKPFDQDACDAYQESLSNASLMILSKLLTTDLEILRRLPETEPGLEFALKAAAEKQQDVEGIIRTVSSKRIARNRVRRILTNLLLGYFEEDHLQLTKPFSAHYLRVLAFNDIGRKLLRQIEKDGNIPVLTNLHSNRTRLDPDGFRALEYDVRMSDLFHLSRRDTANIRSDYRRHPILQ